MRGIRPRRGPREPDASTEPDAPHEPCASPEPDAPHEPYASTEPDAPHELYASAAPGAHDGDLGSSPVEFVLVGALLTVLTLAVLQFGLVVYVRNLVHDAAVEGAFHAALADTSLADGTARTEEIIARSIGAEYAAEVSVRELDAAGQRQVEVTVITTLPVVGLLGPPRTMEVTARAPAETLE